MGNSLRPTPLTSTQGGLLPKTAVVLTDGSLMLQQPERGSQAPPRPVPGHLSLQVLLRLNSSEALGSRQGGGSQACFTLGWVGWRIASKQAPDASQKGRGRSSSSTYVHKQKHIYEVFAVCYGTEELGNSPTVQPWKPGSAAHTFSRCTAPREELGPTWGRSAPSPH